MHLVPLRAYFAVFAALMGLTALTVFVAFIDLGVFNTTIALLIAGVKATLVILIFMHVFWSSRLTQVFAASGVLFLLIAFVLSLADYATRHFDRLPTGWE